MNYRQQHDMKTSKNGANQRLNQITDLQRKKPTSFREKSAQELGQ
jgi:hypothetical protein